MDTMLPATPRFDPHSWNLTGVVHPALSNLSGSFGASHLAAQAGTYHGAYSQPALLNTPAPNATEVQGYSLRRKTPRGTIDDGYDGSLAHLPSGPPPAKHVIRSSSSDPFSPGFDSSMLNQWPVPAALQWAFASTGTRNLGVRTLGSSTPSNGANVTILGNDFPAADRLPLPSQQIHQATYPTPLQMPQPSPIQPYSPTPGPAAWAPAGFSPSPAWGTPHGIPLAGVYIPQNAAVDSAFMLSHLPIHPGFPNDPPLDQTLVARLLVNAHHAQNNASLATQNQRLKTLSLQPQATWSEYEGDDSENSQSLFRERIFAKAHRAHTNLLSYLGHSKTSHGIKSAGDGHPSHKLLIYPKPPKRSQPAPGPLLPPAISYGSGRASGVQATAPNIFPNAHGHQNASHFPEVGYPTASPITRNPTLMSGSGCPAIYNNTEVHFKSSRDVISPVAQAKSCLAGLAHYCERGNWTWVDGIMLGGCLHYALGCYEEALEWFNRIISLESTHVEAISNIAATLYSLNRPEEARQNWIRAIELQPSHLEAVENLTTFLSSRDRNKDAIHIINHVQRSLRTTPPPAGPPHQAQTTSSSPENPLGGDVSTLTSLGFLPLLDQDKPPGFGSSGYAIPGSENARMLLLLHAKGNLLYAQKDVQGASEAYEEAIHISTGKRFSSIQTLTRTIQFALSSTLGVVGQTSAKGPHSIDDSTLLLLPPEVAKKTAQLIFYTTQGQLPGLRYLTNASSRKSATSTASIALLSLAKIFQDSMSCGGSTSGLVRYPPSMGDVLALYYLSLSLQESPSTANNVGILLASVQLSATATVMSSMVASTDLPVVSGIARGSGLELAFAYYNYGLTLDAKHVHLRTNLGSLLKDVGQLDMAIHMYVQAVESDPNFDIALTNLANAVKDRGRVNEAIAYYRRAVKANPNFPEAICGLSTALNTVCDWRGRGGAWIADGRYDRWHVNDEGMLFDVRDGQRASGLMKRVCDNVARQLKEASFWGCGVMKDEASFELLVAQLETIVDASSDGPLDIRSELRQWLGQPWEGSRVVRLIERATRVVMRRWYRDKHVRGISSLPTAYPRPRLPPSLPVPSAPTVLPFHTFTIPLGAKDIRMISQRNAQRITYSALRASWLPRTVYAPPAPPNPQLNIGYMSSDFNNHPLAHLMQSVFGFHNPSRAKAFCYALAASDKSVHRHQIEQEAPVFRDVSAWSSEKIVNQIVDDGIHILVNLNGYTRGARNEIFAARPAPIQMAFMGFAGTLGAEWCDYLLADATTIPRSTLRPHRNNIGVSDVFRDEANSDGEWVYGENIIFCRDTFFCCDHLQSSAHGPDEADMTWADEQKRRWKMRKDLFPNLSDDMIIMGNFNQLYKIDPTTFRTWLRILGHCPKAVLWLLRFPELGEVNLKRTAQAWASDEVASRIIFTDVAPKQQHISRARVCDLVLDTPECNAHTTAADILWANTPLLTLPRYEFKMCSRIAASILQGALPKTANGRNAALDLIVSNEGEYEAAAIRLVNGLSYLAGPAGSRVPEGRLNDLRKLLWGHKRQCDLFNTRRWVNDLEEAYEKAWEHWTQDIGGDIYL